MKILFVDSGASGFHSRYAYDIYTTLIKDFHNLVKQVAPQNLSHSLISQFRPDLLLVVHGSKTPLEYVRYAKSHNATTALWLVEDPYEIDHHLNGMVGAYDYVFSNESLALPEYAHPRGYYLPWCCNPRVHKSIVVSSHYQSDICFVGMGFVNRVQILNAIEPVLNRYKVVLIGDWERWGEKLHPNLRRFVIPIIDNFWEVQKYYNGAKINLNLHRDPTNPQVGNHRGVGAVCPNDRTFALAGCGVFQIVDKVRPRLWECFTEGRELIGFSDPQELAQKIEWYLNQPGQRSMISKAAQRRAYTQHTFKHRLAEIFRIIGRTGPNRASARQRLNNSSGAQKFVFRQ